MFFLLKSIPLRFKRLQATLGFANYFPGPKCYMNIKDLNFISASFNLEFYPVQNIREEPNIKHHFFTGCYQHFGNRTRLVSNE